MKRWIITLFLLPLAGCAYHPQPSVVFGASGKQYTAPALCQALVACRNAAESSCYYEAESVTDLNGTSRDTTYCKEVK